MLKLFAQSWKGEASLAKAFWIVYFLFSIILSIIITLIFSFTITNFVYADYADVIMLIMFPYTLFSAICVWRCGKNSALIWNILSKIVVILAVLNSLIAMLYVAHIF